MFPQLFFKLFSRRASQRKPEEEPKLEVVNPSGRVPMSGFKTVEVIWWTTTVDGITHPGVHSPRERRNPAGGHLGSFRALCIGQDLLDLTERNLPAAAARAGRGRCGNGAAGGPRRVCCASFVPCASAGTTSGGAEGSGNENFPHMLDLHG